MSLTSGWLRTAKDKENALGWGGKGVGLQKSERLGRSKVVPGVSTKPSFLDIECGGKLYDFSASVINRPQA